MGPSPDQRSKSRRSWCSRQTWLGLVFGSMIGLLQMSQVCQIFRKACHITSRGCWASFARRLFPTPSVPLWRPGDRGRWEKRSGGDRWNPHRCQSLPVSQMCDRCVPDLLQMCQILFNCLQISAFPGEGHTTLWSLWPRGLWT